jgi:hypothetical protein
MDEKTALHTAARRYCQARFSEWVQVYEELQLKENWRVEKLFQPGWTYSGEAYKTFPRYRIAKETQVEIERLVADSSGSLSELKTSLIDAAAKAQAKLEHELTNGLARKAIREEAEEPLPGRRVLNEDESKTIWQELKRTWHIEEGYWFPLKNGTIPPNILAFHTDYFQNIAGQELIRQELENRHVSTVFLLHEFGDPEYEIDLGIFEPGYRDGGEQYSTSKQMDWMIYA